MRKMTQENSYVLKNHSIRPRVFRTICYHNDHPVICSTARKRNIFERLVGERRAREGEVLNSERERERGFEELERKYNRIKPSEASYIGDKPHSSRCVKGL